MSSADPSRRRRWSAVAVLAAAAMVVSAGSASHAAEPYPRPADGTLQLTGHGWGHGIGMSQYGAYGGALAGHTWSQIIAKYYPGTTLTSIGNPVIRVRVASLGAAVEAFPAAGLRVTWDLVNSSVLPTTRDGATITRWRLAPGPKASGTPTRFQLQYQVSGSTTWRFYATASVPSTGAFLNSTSGTVTTSRGATQVVYRGQVRALLIGAAGAESLVPVVALPMESYLLSVVPSEMPASWEPDAVAAQAVAARSFAEHHRRYAPLSPAWYDVYDDTRSQVFHGTKVGATSYEYAASTSAVRATASQAATYQGRIAFTQFSSSSGGWTAAGSQPYLVAQPDPWDAVAANPNHTWTATVPVTSLEKAFPAMGSFETLTVTTRTGGGDQGGRVGSVTLKGSQGQVATTGNGLRSALGLKSNWFAPQVESSASFPRDLTRDRLMDVVAVEASTGAMRVYPSNGAAGWKPTRLTGGSWAAYPKLLTAGAWDADPISDVLAQDSSGRLLLFSGRGDATFAPARAIGSGWTMHDLVVPVGDFDGDGLTDLLSRRASNGELWLYRGNGTGGFKGYRTIGGGWEIFSAVVGAGDLDGDRHVDVLARAHDGLLYLYPGNGAGGWHPRKLVGSGWHVFASLTAGGDFDGDGRNDVLARATDGKLYLYPGTGDSRWKPRRLVGNGWQVFSTVLQ